MSAMDGLLAAENGISGSEGDGMNDGAEEELHDEAVDAIVDILASAIGALSRDAEEQLYVSADAFNHCMAVDGCLDLRKFAKLLIGDPDFARIMCRTASLK